MENTAEIERKDPVDFQPEFPRGGVKSHRYNAVAECKFHLQLPNEFDKISIRLIICHRCPLLCTFHGSIMEHFNSNDL